MESKVETLQNQIIKETFAKNRMSQALSVQKKIGYGRTDRQTHTYTDRQIFVFIKWISNQLDKIQRPGWSFDSDLLSLAFLESLHVLLLVFNSFVP